MTPTLIIAETCPYCTKGRSLHDLMPFGGTRICTSCYQSHLDALKALSSGGIPTECSECHTTTARLMELAIAGDTELKMAVHNERGCYRFMCKQCDREYVRKRRELYGPTEFGYRTGIQ